MLHTYEQKSQSRDELVREARRAIRKLTQEMAQSICNHPEVEELMQTLSAQLESVKGKKSYGYLPKSVKKTVDEVVDKLEEIPVVKQCYDQWCVLQNEVESYYHDKPREKKKLSQEKEFRQIKNAVIQEAERIRLGEITFEDADLSDHDEPEQGRGESYTCWELRQIIRDESLPLADRDGAAEELERLAERGDAHAQYLDGTALPGRPSADPGQSKGERLAHPGGRAWSARGPVCLWANCFSLTISKSEIRTKGIRWLKQAAENGNHFAAYRLGKEYLKGEVVTQRFRQSRGVVHPFGRGRQPVCPVYAGKAVSDRAGSDSRTRPKRWTGSAAPPPRETSTRSSSWNARVTSIRPPSCWRPPACSTT